MRSYLGYHLAAHSQLGDFGLETSKGSIHKHTPIMKFGRNESVGTTFVPVNFGGLYRTPQVASATSLRVKAGNVADTAAGNGAREVTIEGLDETGTFASEAVATAGTSASSPTTTTFIRHYRAFVSKSGRYTSWSSGSHDADIVIENSAGTEDWLTIDSNLNEMGQSEVGCYSVPLGSTLYIQRIRIDTDASKTVNVLLMKRESILDTAAPYDAKRLIRSYSNLPETIPDTFDPPLKLDALTDFYVLAKVSTGTTAVSVKWTGYMVED